MKSPRCSFVAAGLVSLLMASLAFAQSVTLEMSVNNVQTSSLGPAQITNPYRFQAVIRHGGTVPNFSDWGPVLQLPSAGGASTPNFTGTPNTVSGDYLVSASYASQGALAAAFPTGGYSVSFGGVTPPSPSTFSAGLDFSSGGFASTAPYITGVNNGATWSGGLQIYSGVTTLNLSDFSEYGTAPYAGTGTLINIGIYDSLGNVVSAASQTAYYIPGQSLNDAKITDIGVNSTWLTTGVNYTLQIQYGILANAMGSAVLDSTSFEGAAVYYSTTKINLTAVPEPATVAVIFGVLAIAAAAWDQRRERTAS